MFVTDIDCLELVDGLIHYKASKTSCLDVLSHLLPQEDENDVGIIDLVNGLQRQFGNSTALADFGSITDLYFISPHPRASTST